MTPSLYVGTVGILLAPLLDVLDAVAARLVHVLPEAVDAAAAEEEERDEDEGDQEDDDPPLGGVGVVD